MYDNVPERFVPTRLPDLAFTLPRVDFVHNTDELNATYEILARGIEERGWGDLTAVHDADESETVTYRELLERVERCAGGLLDLGVEPGDRVLWQFGNTPVAQVVHLATWKVGAVAVPATPTKGANAMAYVVEDTEPTVAFTTSALFEEVGGVLEDASPIEEIVVLGDADRGHNGYADVLERAEPYSEYAPTEPLDLAALYYTSGTTGDPKANMASHAEEVAVAEIDGGEARDVRLGETMFFPGPVGHGFGIVDKIKIPFRHGASTVMARRPDPERMLEIVEAYEVGWLSMVPTMMRMILGTVDPGEYDLSSVRMVLSAGERLDRETYDRWTSATGLEVGNCLGATETNTTYVVPYRRGEKFAPDVSLGRPLPGTEVRIMSLDDPDVEAGRGEKGFLALRGASGVAYWNNANREMPGLMDDVLDDDGWTVLDDAFSLDEDRNLYHEGRLDNLIVTGGRGVSPVEVEETLVRHERIDAVAVVGVPDGERGERVKAFVKKADPDDDEAELTEEIQRYAKSRLEKYMYPREVEYVEEFARNDMGEIKRAELRD